MKDDLTDGTGRPKWILTTYGPGKNAPASLLEGQEYSFEELRTRYYELQAKGQQSQADQEAQALWSKSLQLMEEIARNADQVMKFMEDAEKKHPNRYDLCKTDGSQTREQIAQASQSATNSSGVFGTATGFGQGATGMLGKPTVSAFSQPVTASGFGAPSFGQPSRPAFGQPPANSVFGKSAFGSSGFGQTATIGQPGQPAPGFGQPSTPSAFGQARTTPPAFNQMSQGPAFGQPSQPTSAFGQLSQPVSAFGQPSQPVSAFGKPPLTATPFGQPAQAAPAFGQLAFGSSGFGQATQKNPFGAPTASVNFGSASQPQSSFNQANKTSSTFGQPAQPSAFGLQAQTSAFGQPAQSSAFGQANPFLKQAQTPFGHANNTETFSATIGTTFASRGSVEEMSDEPMSPQPSGSAPSAQTAGAVPFTQGGDNRQFGIGDVAESTPLETPFLTPVTAPTNTATNLPSALAASVPSWTTAQPAVDGPLESNRRPLHYTQTLPQAPSTQDLSNRLTSYRGQPVQYFDEIPCYKRPDGKGWERIWFPEGGNNADVQALLKPDKLSETQSDPDKYTDEVKDAYKFLYSHCKFDHGKMPLVPPVRNWIDYDF